MSWIAPATLATTGLAALATAISVWQRSHYNPRPHFTHRIRSDGWEEPRTIIFTVTNIGSENGKDLTLELRNLTNGEFEELWFLIDLGPSWPMDSTISVVTGRGEKFFPRDGQGGRNAPEGERPDMRWHVDLFWHEPPDLDRRRHAIFQIEQRDRNVVERQLTRRECRRVLRRRQAAKDPWQPRRMWQ